MPDPYILFIIAVALAFDFINGFHDAANSIATVVSTRVLTPRLAVLWAALFNCAAAFGTGTLVASTVGKGIVRPELIDPNLILAALTGAIAWNLFTWFYGLPSSSSHALIGGLAGAGLVKAGAGSLIWLTPGPNVLIWKGILGIAIYIVVAPILGFVLGMLFMVVLSWLCHELRAGPHTVDRWFRRLQLVSSGVYSYSHGSNDAQKTMGIIYALLVAGGYGATARAEGIREFRGWVYEGGAAHAYSMKVGDPAAVRTYQEEAEARSKAGQRPPDTLHLENGAAYIVLAGEEADTLLKGKDGKTVVVPGRLVKRKDGTEAIQVHDTIAPWIILACYVAIGLGTYFGGWRIVKTMGSKITKLAPFGGFSAETGGGVTILAMSHWGIPVSTTHTITGAIVGVGSTRGARAVKWGVARRIVWAWVLTIPCSALVAALVMAAFKLGSR